MSRDNSPRKILQRHRSDFDLRQTAPAFGDDDRQRVRVSIGNQPAGESSRIPTGVPSVTDTLQNTRMDAIERAIRDLTEDMARNRATFSSLVGELRDTNNNGIPDAMERRTNGHAGGWDEDEAHDISYLIGRMDSNVEAKFKELARAWSVLGDRLKAIEEVVEDLDADGIGLSQISPDMAAQLKSLSVGLGRLDELEKLLTSLPLRLTELERRLQSIATSGPNSLDVERLTSKIEAIEHLIKDSDGAVELGPVMSGLRDVEAGMRGVGGQLREVDNRTGDVNLMLESVSERQQRMEDVIEAQQAQISELLGMLRDNGGLTVVGGSGIDPDSIASSVGALVTDRFAGLATQLQQRIGQLEETVRASAERPVMVNGSGELDASYLNDAVSKIISNQHTLASSMDEWRTQSREDVSGLAARMDRLENRPITTAGVSQETIDEIKQSIRDLRAAAPHSPSTVTPSAPVDGWTRFKMWLFGTTDWYGESWGGLREEDERVWQDPRRDSNQSRPVAPNPPPYDRNTGYDQRA